MKEPEYDRCFQEGAANALHDWNRMPQCPYVNASRQSRAWWAGFHKLTEA